MREEGRMEEKGVEDRSKNSGYSDYYRHPINEFIYCILNLYGHLTLTEAFQTVRTLCIEPAEPGMNDCRLVDL